MMLKSGASPTSFASHWQTFILRRTVDQWNANDIHGYALAKPLTGKASRTGQPNGSFAQTMTYTNGGCGAALQGP